MSPARPPDRSLQQRMDALKLGNDIRMYRAQVKRDVALCKVNADELLVSDDSRLDTMKVADLLRAVPGMGKIKLGQLLRKHGISYSKTISGISARQRGQLLVALRSHRSRSNLYAARKAVLNDDA